LAGTTIVEVESRDRASGREAYGFDEQPTSIRPPSGSLRETGIGTPPPGYLNTRSSDELPPITVRISVRKGTPPALDDEQGSIRLPDEAIEIIAQVVLKG